MPTQIKNLVEMWISHLPNKEDQTIQKELNAMPLLKQFLKELNYKQVIYSQFSHQPLTAINQVKRLANLIK